jgi:hypothetical protein
LQRTFLLSLILAGCAKSEKPVNQAVFKVIVSNGSGGGYYQVGSTVHIWADLNLAQQAFKEWIGDEQLLMDRHSAHSTFQMPSRDVTFEGRYREVPVWTAEQETIADRRVFYYFPQNPVGVITLYHGSGGDAAEWTETSVERRLFVNEAVAAGYGIVLGACGFGLLWAGSNALACMLAMVGLVIYAGVYTYWLKRRTHWATLIGSLSGAMPPVLPSVGRFMVPPSSIASISPVFSK